MTLMQSYTRALRAMDWEFEFSDDANVYNSGRKELLRLRSLQNIYDTGGVIWNQYAPANYKVEKQ